MMRCHNSSGGCLDIGATSMHARRVDASLRQACSELSDWTMESRETGLLARNQWVARRPLTVAESHRMGEIGILMERDRVELVGGELIAVSRIGREHAGCVNALNRRLVGERGVVAVQNPVPLH